MEQIDFLSNLPGKTIHSVEIENGFLVIYFDEGETNYQEFKLDAEWANEVMFDGM